MTTTNRPTPHSDGPRTIHMLTHGWRFSRNDPRALGTQPAAPDFDDSAWQDVRVPHDWAITGPFDPDNDRQTTAIVADGERREREHVGRTGGLPHAGLGWYRYTFELSEEELEGREIDAEFDGVMSHARVYCNGDEVGARPYGYASFSCRLTAHLRAGRNVLAVSVDNPAFASRWYPGAGVYRHARIVATRRVRIAQWGVWVRPKLLENGTAEIHVETRVDNRDKSERHVDVVLTVEPASRAAGGPAAAETVATSTVSDLRLRAGETSVATATLRVDRPRLWDLAEPNLYVLRAVVTARSGDADGLPLDETATRFGVRSVDFDSDEGFRLNGRRTKLRGVCMHHDLGPLGAAVNRDARRRQLVNLEEMGCNAIRTSHNPPEPELLDLCDELGFVVIDEAFDEWRIGKVGNGYHRHFDEWAHRDLRDMIVRDRNHPCVIMWSIGNEINEQKDAGGAAVARMLTEIVHDTDPDRPSTAGLNLIDRAIENHFPQQIDIVGLNYEAHRYTDFRRRFPDWIIYGSETESCVSSRSTYYFPVEEEWDRLRESLHVTSYDVAAPPWGYTPDVELEAQHADKSILGSFVWTGWDYLGEPTPYKTEWPSRSSYFGIVDLAGIPKDRYYLYQAAWIKEPVLHLLPHWTWPHRDGEHTPVHCYTNCASVELFVNGRSLGERRLRPASLAERWRLIWNDVRYEPGELVAIGRGTAGEEIRRVTIPTAGAPSRVTLCPEASTLEPRDDAMAFVRIAIQDENGTLCPQADHAVEVTVEGDAELVAMCAGDQTSVEPFQANPRGVFRGEAVAYVRGRSGGTGEVVVRASANGLRIGETLLRYAPAGHAAAQ